MENNNYQYDLKIKGNSSIKDGIIENINKDDAIIIGNILKKYGYEISYRKSPWQNINLDGLIDKIEYC